MRSIEDVLHQKMWEAETAQSEVNTLKRAIEIMQEADAPRTPLVRAADIAGVPAVTVADLVPENPLAVKPPVKRWP